MKGGVVDRTSLVFLILSKARFPMEGEFLLNLVKSLICEELAVKDSVDGSATAGIWEKRGAAAFSKRFSWRDGKLPRT